MSKTSANVPEAVGPKPGSKTSPHSHSESTPTSSSKSKLKPRPELRPKPTPKPKNPWKSFYLLERKTNSQWNPWPVKRHRPGALFEAAQLLVKERNEEHLDNLIDRVVLLPASNSTAGIQGGAGGVDLFSIRSPRNLPVRIHLWLAGGDRGKVMMRKRSGYKVLFSQFLRTFDVSIKSGEPCKHYDFWKTVALSQKVLSELEIPEYYHQAMYERWWSMNTFRFMDLPPELRIMVLSYAMGHSIEPYAIVYRPNQPNPPNPPFKSNTNLLLVSKLLRREVTAVMMSRVTFVFRKHGQLLRFFEQISKENLYALQSLELNFDHASLLDFFGARVFNNFPIPGFSTSDYYLTDSLFTDRLRLKHLRINFPHPREHRSCKNLRYACQRVICLYIWAAARRCLRDIPNVEFGGCIKDDQKKEWLEVLDLERKGILTDPIEMKQWQNWVWRVP